MLSICLHVQLSVFKIAKSRHEISCSTSKYRACAVFRISINDVIEKLGSIYSDDVYIFARTAHSFENSKKS